MNKLEMCYAKVVSLEAIIVSLEAENKILKMQNTKLLEALQQIAEHENLFNLYFDKSARAAREDVSDIRAFARDAIANLSVASTDGNHKQN